jgi:hypothetical protein
MLRLSQSLWLFWIVIVQLNGYLVQFNQLPSLHRIDKLQLFLIPRSSKARTKTISTIDIKPEPVHESTTKVKGILPKIPEPEKFPIPSYMIEEDEDFDEFFKSRRSYKPFVIPQYSE